MGGMALKEHCRRFSKEEFLAATEAFQRKFRGIFRVPIQLIPYYLEKDSFGDADFVVESDSLPPDWKQTIIKKFGLQDGDYKSNGDVFSMAFCQLQVDLILTQKKYFRSSINYFEFNDLGNLSGRLAKKLGIKHGHKGLSLVIRHKSRADHILAEIELETDNAKEKIYSILGLDPNFIPNSLDDIFNFVASSRFFDPDIYLLDNRNAVSRVRDKKRKTYSEFLKWCEANPDSKKYSFPEKNERGGYSLREPYYTEIVLKEWPWVEKEVDQIIAEFELDQKFKEVYNGDVVKSLTGFEGKCLGAFMKKMQPKINKELWIAQPLMIELNVTNLFLELGGVKFKENFIQCQP